MATNGATPLGLRTISRETPRVGEAPTLGFETQSLWDCRLILVILPDLSYRPRPVSIRPGSNGVPDEGECGPGLATMLRTEGEKYHSPFAEAHFRERDASPNPFFTE